MEVEPSQKNGVSQAPTSNKQSFCAYDFPVFPADVETVYANLEEAFMSIQELAYNVECDGMELMYEEQKASNPDCRPVVTLACRMCDSFIKFLEIGDDYIIHENQNRHEHPTDQLSEAERRYISLFGFEEIFKNDPRPIQSPISSQPMVVEEKQTQPSIPTPPKPKQIKKPPAVDIIKQLKFLESKQFQVVVRYARGSAGRLPQVIVLASQWMRIQYSIFGDWIAITVMPSSIKNFEFYDVSYQIVVVWGYDAGLNPILLSLALVADESVASYYTVLKSLMKIHRSRITCLVTDNNQPLLKTIEIMKEVGYLDPTHLLDYEVFTEQITRRTERSARQEETRKLVQSIIGQCILERAQQLMKQLDQIDSNLADYLLSVQSRICMWALPNRFMGMFVSGRSQITEMVKQNLQPPDSFANFFNAVVAQEEQFLLKKQKPTDEQSNHYHERIEELFEDARLEVVRKELSSRVFTIFLMNYVQQFNRTDCLVLKEESRGQSVPSDKPVFIVDLKLIRCSCQYSWKTGLPCWHMLWAAQDVPTLSYMTLVGGRWRTKSSKLAFQVATNT